MTDATLVLQTERCQLRPITHADADALHRLWSTRGVRKFLWDDEAIPLARTLEIVQQNEGLFRERRFGLWGAWQSGGDRALTGFAGLWPFREPPVFELLYGVAEPLWGQGYATEIADAVRRDCFARLAMRTVTASTDVGNTASMRVLEKLGFVFVERVVVNGLATVFYESRALADTC